MKIIQQIKGWFKPKITLSLGEKALIEVCQMITYNKDNRNKLRNNGWNHVVFPIRVNNERLWKHPKIGYCTESEALKWENT